MKENINENLPNTSIASGKYPLTELQKNGLLCILINAYDNLNVLANISRLKSVNNDENIYQPKTIAERIKSHAYLKIYEELDRAIHHSTRLDSEAKKIQNDRNFLLKFIKDFINELTTSNSTTCVNTLFTILNIFESIQAEETQLLDETKENLITIKKLQSDIHLEGADDDTMVTDLDKIVRSAIDIQRSVETENNVKINFVEKWNKCRIYQNNLRGFMALSDKVHESEKAQDQIQNEVTVYTNVIKFEELFIQDLNKKLEETIQIYNKQTAEKDNDIADIIKKTEQQFDEMTKLKAEYEKKLGKINDWLNEKSEMKRKADLEERRRLAAVRIQSWWRMLMVRKGFGPFKLKLLGKNKKKGKTKK